MAQLKDTVISGSLRVTDTTYTNDLIIGASKTKNWFLGTPSSADGAPTFRALVAADIPTLSITDKTSGTLTVARGGTGLTTASYKNAIITGNGTTATNAFTVIRTDSGALYATAQDGAAVFGTLPVAQGGTGATTFASGELLIGNGTSAVGTRAIINNTSVGVLGWATSATTASNLRIVNVNTLAYWNGAYNSTNSNLTYCVKGAFGNACTYAVDDATANGALSTGTGLTTERSVYYGLCIINNASQTRATSIYAPTGAGTVGHVLAAAGGTSAPAWNGGLVLTGTAAASWKASFEGTTEANATAGTEAVRMKGGLRVDKVIRANKVYNAIWNDYAEYREAEISTPGACMVENDNGCLTIADERLVPGACIISDTYGFCQGETEKANVPIAVTGRVLAYTYWPREMYHAGMAVCSAPNGTIDIMTREEIRDYPDAIVGIVSEIPDYEVWGSGNIKIDNRIWIKVK